ncbi:MAG: hypothetical protein EXX96DRAFT_546321 [Benjaminiella poitrasii]|nr:MAG: hypothetical protein EXX96DRAFT_546321 [Benjaminiella poitrasii]
MLMYCRMNLSLGSKNCIKMKPAPSPGLNSIGHVWSELARKLYSRIHVINNTKDLQWELVSAWELLGIEFAGNLFESTLRRCQIVTDSKKNSTKYSTAFFS